MCKNISYKNLNNPLKNQLSPLKIIQKYNFVLNPDLKTKVDL